jgi:hypothetical protein
MGNDLRGYYAPSGGRVLVAAHTKPYHQKRRFPEWIDPPEECPCCGGPAVLVHNRALYGKNIGEWPVVWYCLCCEASVGCHPFSVYPLGRMADRATKNARAQVHALLDPLWQSGRMTREQAYWRLAELMGVPPWEQVHVGQMTMAECARAAECLRPLSLVEDFGA